MNFFEDQDSARQKSQRLMLSFLLAVVVIILVTDIILYGLIQLAPEGQILLQASYPTHFGSFNGTVLFFAGTSVALLVIIFIGSVIRRIQLRGGAQSIVSMLAARQVISTTTDFTEKRLLNVVEEMSIASGTPVPKIYILDNEDGINAFVAGELETEVVLVVTAGLLKHLNRDELQAVIGHEYSHIFNGDIKINIRLMILLAGILGLSQMGKFLIYSVMRSRYGNYGRPSRDSSNGQAKIASVLIGAVLFVMGLIGYYVGLMLKSAISRQREFLADASGAQYTRNPIALAQALMKIKSAQSGSTLTGKNSEDVSHFCFSNAVGERMMQIFATHPPIDKRITALDPRQQAVIETENWHAVEPESTTKQAQQGDEGSMQLVDIPIAGLTNETAMKLTTPDKVTAQVGRPSNNHLAVARSITKNIPQDLLDLAHDPTRVQIIVYGLLMMSTDEVPTLEACLQKCIPDADYDQLAEHKTQFQHLPTALKLPLLEIALPQLCTFTSSQRQQLQQQAEQLIIADNSVHYFEWLLLLMLESHYARSTQTRESHSYSIKELSKEMSVLLTQLALLTGEDKALMQASYEAAVQHLQLTLSMATGKICAPSELQQVFSKIIALRYRDKKKLLEACCLCVMHDDEINLMESEAIRVIADALACPMPPLWLDATAA